MKELDQKEMQELMIDYAFGRLTEYESNIFESNLINFPEMKIEIIEIRKSFSKVNREDLINHLENKTSNLSYKIKQEQYKINENKNLKKNILKFSIPIIGLISFFFIMRQVEINKLESSNSLPEFVLSDAEIGIIFDEFDNAYFDPYYNTFYAELETFETKENVDATINASNTTIYNYLNEISETEFNELLDKIDNEEFNM